MTFDQALASFALGAILGTLALPFGRLIPGLYDRDQLYPRTFFWMTWLFCWPLMLLALILVGLNTYRQMWWDYLGQYRSDRCAKQQHLRDRLDPNKTWQMYRDDTGQIREHYVDRKY